MADRCEHCATAPRFRGDGAGKNLGRVVRETLCVLLIALPVLLTPAAQAQTAPVPVVAAENVYGDLAAQIGGKDVNAISILSNPEQDPHLFEASPSVARALSAARVVIYNGADYDPWMTQAARRRAVGRPAGDRGRRSAAQEAGRQSASLVRSAGHSRHR